MVARLWQAPSRVSESALGLTLHFCPVRRTCGTVCMVTAAPLSDVYEEVVLGKARERPCALLWPLPPLHIHCCAAPSVLVPHL